MASTSLHHGVCCTCVDEFGHVATLSPVPAYGLLFSALRRVRIQQEWWEIKECAVNPNALAGFC